jgi:hypothetical protein
VITGDQRIEALLRSAAADTAWPPVPDLRPAVLARIAAIATEEPEALRRAAAAGSASRARPPLRLVRALAVALLALLIVAGVATALGFRLPGMAIERVERLPPAGTGFDLGSPVPLAEARDGEPPRVLVPAGLPEPATAFVLGAGRSRIVTLAWRASGGGAVVPGTDLSVAITAVAGGTEEGLLTKLLGPGTTIEAVMVGGDRGWWIAGAPHDLLVTRPDGTAGVLTSRLAGDTLLFARDGTLYRIESALGRDATLVLAASLR